MRKPGSMKGLEELGRVRLSQNFYLRDFLMSEIANFYGIPNIPENPDLAIETGTRLCTELLEPLQNTVRSTFHPLRIPVATGHRLRQRTRAWCQRGNTTRGITSGTCSIGPATKGAAACIVIPWFADRYATGADWRALAWWIHDHLPYSHLEFYPKLCAFNIHWSEHPKRRIDSFIRPEDA